jgi:hypothetical protein
MRTSLQRQVRTLFLQRVHPSHSVMHKARRECELRTRAELNRQNNTHATHSAARIATPLARRHAGREPHNAIKRAQSFHEGRASCEPPNNSSPTRTSYANVQSAGARAGRSHSRELHTGDSHRETAQTAHTRPRREERSYKRPTPGVLLGAAASGMPQWKHSTLNAANQPFRGERGSGVEGNTRAHTHAMNSGHKDLNRNKLLGRLPSTRTSRARCARPAGTR